jgi:hypothetical protein
MVESFVSFRRLAIVSCASNLAAATHVIAALDMRALFVCLRIIAGKVRNSDDHTTWPLGRCIERSNRIFFSISVSSVRSASMHQSLHVLDHAQNRRILLSRRGMLRRRDEVLEELLIQQLSREVRVHTEHVHVLVILFTAIPRDIVSPKRHEDYNHVFIFCQGPHWMRHAG